MQLENEGMTIIIRPDNIVEVITKEDVKGLDTVEHAKENITLITKAIDGKIRATLSHMPNSYMSKEVMDCYKNANMGECASAMIATSFGAKVLGNFFVKVMGKSDDAPVKLFTKKEEAEKWLLEKIAEANK